jgi:hypothetical protein
VTGKYELGKTYIGYGSRFDGIDYNDIVYMQVEEITEKAYKCKYKRDPSQPWKSGWWEPTERILIEQEFRELTPLEEALL